MVVHGDVLVEARIVAHLIIYPQARMKHVRTLRISYLMRVRYMSTVSIRDVLGAVFVASVILGCSGQDSADFVAAGKAALAKGESKTAIIQLKNALKEAPDSGEVRYLLGTALRTAGDLISAEVELRKAVSSGYSTDESRLTWLNTLVELERWNELLEEANPDKFSTPVSKAASLAIRGEALLGLGRIGEARTVLEQSLALDASAPRAKLGLSKLLARESKRPEALAALEEALAADPNFPEALEFKGSMYAADNKLAEAKPLLKRAIVAKPYSPGAYVALISLLLSAGDTAEAQEVVDSLQRVMPKGAGVTSYTGALVAYAKGDPAKARETLRGVLKHGSDYVPVLLLAGAVEHDLGSYLKAEEYLAQVIQQSPRYAYAHRLLLSTHVRSGRLKEAERDLATLIKLSPEDSKTWFMGGELAFLQGNPAKAVEYYTKFTALDSENLVGKTRLGQSLLANGDERNGIRVLEAVSENPKFPEGGIALVRFYLSKKDLDRALALAGKLRTIHGNNAVVLDLLGDVYLAREQIQQARESFEAAVATSATFLPAVEKLVRLDLRARNSAGAEARLEKVLQADPRSEKAALTLARMKASLGRSPDEVMAAFDRVIAINPASVDGRLGKIAAVEWKGGTKEGLSEAIEASVAVPGDPRILAQVARLQTSAGDKVSALSTLGKLTTIAPNSGAPFLGMVTAHLSDKDWPAARKAVQDGVRVAPEWLPLRAAQLQVAFASGDLAEAAAVAKLMQKKWPTLPAGYVAEAETLSRQERWKEAEGILTEGKKRTSSGRIVLKLHAVMFAQQKYASANEMATNWLKENPKSIEFAALVAQRNLARQDLRTAAAWYEMAVNIDPKNPLAQNNLASTLLKSDDPRAIEVAKKALALAPDNPNVLDTMGSAYLKMGETGRATETLRRASKLAPSSFNIRINLARALSAAGHKSDARAELTAVIKGTARENERREAERLLNTL